MYSKKLYNLGKKIGLNEIDIDNLLKHRIIINELVSLLEPDSYKDGTLYGTVSINNF